MTRSAKAPSKTTQHSALKSAMLSAADTVHVASFLDYREYLVAIYQYLKHHHKISWTRFAECLGFGPTNVLHLICIGKRPLSTKAAQKIAPQLLPKVHQREYFIALTKYQNCRDPRQRDQQFNTLLRLKNRILTSAEDRTILEYFSAWYHPVIREMTFMQEFKSDPEWIAERIFPRIRPEQARKSLDLLVELGLITFDQIRQRHVATSQTISTGDEVASIAIVKYHQESINLGRESLTSVEQIRRDVSAITICVSETTAQQIKNEIQLFRKRMLSIADNQQDGNQVYQLNMQLFPLTRGEK